MGTRSLTTVENERGQEIVCMYRQYDGYPSGHGKELAEFLTGKKLVNGLPCGSDCSKLFNGVPELAAKLVAHFKTANGDGNIYLEPPGTRDVGEEYIYIVRVKDKRIVLTVQAGCVAFFGLPGTHQENMKILFAGPINKFSVEACEAAEKQGPAPPNDFIAEQEAKDTA